MKPWETDLSAVSRVKQYSVIFFCCRPDLFQCYEDCLAAEKNVQQLNGLKLTLQYVWKSKMSKTPSVPASKPKHDCYRCEKNDHHRFTCPFKEAKCYYCKKSMQDDMFSVGAQNHVQDIWNIHWQARYCILEVDNLVTHSPSMSLLTTNLYKRSWILEPLYP